jgi:hypothetical protein
MKYEYEFSLILAHAGVTDEDADRLFEAGCDDASILTRDGVTRLPFDRSAPSLDEALDSAIQNVEQAGLAVARVEIERRSLPPDLGKRDLLLGAVIIDGKILGKYSAPPTTCAGDHLWRLGLLRYVRRKP